MPVQNLLLNTTQDQALSTLGPPVKTSTRDGYKILWYNSTAGSLADLLYFQNDSLVLKSYRVDNTTLQNLIDQHGQPQTTFLRYPSNSQDSLNHTIHLWPDLGLEAITSGNHLNSPVTRIRQFTPTTTAQYNQTWGTSYATTETIPTATQSATSTPLSGVMASSASPPSLTQTLLNFTPTWLIFTTITLTTTLIIFTLLLITKKLRRPKALQTAQTQKTKKTT